MMHLLKSQTYFTHCNPAYLFALSWKFYMYILTLRSVKKTFLRPSHQCNLLYQASVNLVLKKKDVFFQRALAASLDRRAFFKLEETDSGKIQLDLPDINKHESWDIKDLKAQLKFPLCMNLPIYNKILNFYSFPADQSTFFLYFHKLLFISY